LSEQGGGLRRVMVETLLVTPSGALSPGPLSASAVAAGAVLGPAAGLLIALGHMVFELPYVAALVKWAERLNSVAERFEKPMSAAVALFVFYFAAGLVAEARHVLGGGPVLSAAAGAVGSPAAALAAGLFLTAFNPYFLVWWATVGLPLVRGAAENGSRGFAAMYASHVWMDYAWLTLLAALGAGLSRLAGLYAALLLGLAAVLALFGLDILGRAFLRRRLLPF